VRKTLYPMALEEFSKKFSDKFYKIDARNPLPSPPLT
jgi:hypothetical protein